MGQAFAQTANDLPERLRKQVAPGPAAPWHAPDLRGYSGALKPRSKHRSIRPGHDDLPELIDLAQRVNPETRVTWEAARQAAIAIGLVESEYFPMLTLAALGGYQTSRCPRRRISSPRGSSVSTWPRWFPALA